MKDTFYFSHDYNTRTNPKIKRMVMKLGYEGYGLYWAIIEDLYNNANALRTDYDCIAFDLRVDCEKVKMLIEDFGLFTINRKQAVFSSDGVAERLEAREEKSKKAKRSAEARWKNRKPGKTENANASEINANALQSECDSNAIKEKKGKERKIKENKENTKESEKEKIAVEEIQFSDAEENPDAEEINLPDFEKQSRKVDFDGATETLDDVHNIAEFWGLYGGEREMNAIRAVRAFLVNVYRAGMVEYYREQFNAYKAFKMASSQQICDWTTWIGVKTGWREGDWNRSNWRHMLEQVLEKKKNGKPERKSAEEIAMEAVALGLSKLNMDNSTDSDDVASIYKKPK